VWGVVYPGREGVDTMPVRFGHLNHLGGNNLAEGRQLEAFGYLAEQEIATETEATGHDVNVLVLAIQR
jgi:hypothetical protein